MVRSIKRGERAKEEKRTGRSETRRSSKSTVDLLIWTNLMSLVAVARQEFRYNSRAKIIAAAYRLVMHLARTKVIL